jgi:serine/threonine protein kinase
VSASAPAIPGYRIEGLLGEGGMGQVFLAVDEVLERRVAVKVIGPGLAGDGAARARFLREARAMAGVEHPNVVRLYSFGEAYFVMELVEGDTLAARLQRGVVLAPAEALRIARETAAALRAAWRRGIVHRDVKPANILLDAQDRVRVADFGLARREEGEAGATAAGLVVGTPHYMSPEQARGEPTDFRSDVYSLGIVLYEMVAGHRPFTGRTPVEVIAQHLATPLPPIERQGLPAHVPRVIAHMTAKGREERSGSYDDLLRELEGLEPHDDEPRTATMPVPRVVPPTRSRRWFLAAAGVGTLGAAATFLGRSARRASFSVAVAPFYGPDETSSREGRLLASLVESALEIRLPADDVDLVGIEEVGPAVRSRRAAADLVRRLDVDVLAWGEVLRFGDQLEIALRLTSREGLLTELEAGTLAVADLEARRSCAATLAARVDAVYSTRRR